MQQSLTQYKTFYEVAKSENVSKASRVLLISQPAVSKSIKKLEESLGVKLFDRTTIGLNLTAEGKLLYEHLTQAFNNITDAELKLKTFSNINFGHIRIGASQSLIKHLLMSYISIYAREYPNIRLSVSTMHTNKCFEKLTEKKIDLAFLHKSSKNYKEIEYVSLLDIHYCFVASKEYISYFSKIFKDDPDYFANGNILLLDKKNTTRDYIDKIFDTHKIIPRQIMEVNNTETMIDFAKNGVGIACVVEEFIQDELDKKQLVKLPIKFKIPKYSVGYAYNKTNISKELSDFLNVINTGKKK
ncbi:MAG: LysR family transcriptional regulator [Lachnospiraceae bacterium]|nr:LysR family transcriptional regulator [Lachnospiraceae bacterium]